MNLSDEEINQILKSINKYNIYSFDVFDTLISRYVFEPCGIFSIIQDKIRNTALPRNLIDNFSIIRIDAEQKTRISIQKNGIQEITIDEIYSTIGRNYNLTNNEIELLKEIEITTEISNIKPLSKNIKLLKELIINNKLVILISDMYLGSNHIRKLLCNFDDVFNEISIYSSADIKKSKYTGDLYEYLKNELNLNYREWLHIGDNNFSDVYNPSQKGISCVKARDRLCLKHERFIVNKLNNSYSQLSFGCANSLVENSSTNDYIFAATFSAPFLFNYVFYVIKKLISLNAKEVYFISECGYLLKKIADEIIIVYKFNIKTNYIYGSKKAWRIPTESSYSDFIDYIFSVHKNNISLNFLSERLNVSLTDLMKYTSIKGEKTFLDEKKTNHLFKEFQTNKELKELVLNSYSQHTQLLTNYLESIINFNNETIYFVDMYGSGNTLNFVNKLVKNKYPNVVFYCFFYSTYGGFIQTPSCLFHFFNMNYSPTGYWVKLLCRPNFGQPLYYKTDSNGFIHPVLSKFELSEYKIWNYVDYEKGLLDFSKQFAIALKTNSLFVEESILFSKLFYESLFLNEDEFLCNVYGNIPYNKSVADNKIEPSCPKISISCLWKFFLNQNRKLETQFSLISFNRSSLFYKRLFMILRYYNTFFEAIYSIKKDNENFYVTFLGIRIKLSSSTITFFLKPKFIYKAVIKRVISKMVK